MPDRRRPSVLPREARLNRERANKRKEDFFFYTFFQVPNLFLSKIKDFSNSFLKSACSFYLGFILGNLFGTFLKFFRNQIIWDGIILITIIFLFEFLNFIIYIKKAPLGVFLGNFPKRRRPSKASSKFPNKKLLPLSFRRKSNYIILKNFQMGILLGLFIDAFKVGS